jgi:hypothetical protein
MAYKNNSGQFILARIYKNNSILENSGELIPAHIYKNNSILDDCLFWHMFCKSCKGREEIYINNIRQNASQFP